MNVDEARVQRLLPSSFIQSLQYMNKKRRNYIPKKISRFEYNSNTQRSYTVTEDSSAPKPKERKKKKEKRKSVQER